MAGFYRAAGAGAAAAVAAVAVVVFAVVNGPVVRRGQGADAS
jgi:hypothetical protein